MKTSIAHSPFADSRIRANIVSWDGGGLGTDIDVLMTTLACAGCDVAFKGRRERRPAGRVRSLLGTANIILAQQWARLTKRPQFDVNFFLESVFPEYLPSACVNCLFVNPEWFRDENLRHLSKLDFLLCKTPSGVDAIRELPVPARNIGFASPDRLIAGHQRPHPIRCVHLAGQSALKGTEAVVEVWSHHPEWPHLTVVRRAKRYGGETAPPLQPLPNVRYEAGYLSEQQLRLLQNDCEVHVIPSQAEGFGHVIGEAMSCAAVVVTTDAPPMNELVEPDRGVLVQVARTETKYRSKLNFVDLGDLETKLGMVFAMAPEQRLALAQTARSWYDAQNAQFQSALAQFLNEEVRSARS